MAQRVEVQLTDDLSGVAIRAGKGETVTFSLDGTSYKIDLTAKNASMLRKALRPYIEAGRPIGAGGPIKASGGRAVRTKISAGARAVNR
jgi:nucleoid-associated protein Lsr2